MNSSTSSDLQEARKTILSWRFIALTVSLFVFLFSFSFAIGVPSTAAIDQPVYLRAAFISFVHATSFLTVLFLLFRHDPHKDCSYWLTVLGFSSVILAGSFAVFYRYYEALLNTTLTGALAHVGWGILVFVGMTVLAKFLLRAILGRNNASWGNDRHHP